MRERNKGQIFKSIQIKDNRKILTNGSSIQEFSTQKPGFFGQGSGGRQSLFASKVLSENLEIRIMDLGNTEIALQLAAEDEAEFVEDDICPGSVRRKWDWRC